MKDNQQMSTFIWTFIKNDKVNIKTKLLVVKEKKLEKKNRKIEVLIRNPNVLKSTIFENKLDNPNSKAEVTEEKIK